MASTQIQPQTANTTETMKKKVALVRQCAAPRQVGAPTDCATRMVAAMPMPNTVPEDEKTAQDWHWMSQSAPIFAEKAGRPRR